MAGAAYTSRRQYLSQSELAQYAQITILDATEADDQISQAEEVIDGYLGFQQKAMSDDIYGRVSAASNNTITLEVGRHINVFQNNYFLYCEVEILDGTGAGQRQVVSSSTFAGKVTVVANWTTNPDSTSHYRIYQLGKIPRIQDQYYDGIFSPFTYYKSIPEAVKRATAAQVQYMITQGVNFFGSDATSMQSERIGDYSYNRSSEGVGNQALIAPKAKVYLRGIMNRKGRYEGEIES